MPTNCGCFLRISGEDWVNQVFENAIYYTNLKKKLKHGDSVLFIYGTDKGDSIVGCGRVDCLRERSELASDDQMQCEDGGWSRAIVFTYVKRFDKPLLVKTTYLRDSKLRGRYLHGAEFDTVQLQTILDQGKDIHIQCIHFRVEFQAYHSVIHVIERCTWVFLDNFAGGF